jgi:FkbM family methyltransferase
VLPGARVSRALNRLQMQAIRSCIRHVISLGVEDKPATQREMEIVKYSTRHGLICHYSSDEVIGESLKRYGEWAEQELYLLSTFIPRGGWVVDVGANVGTHALAFSRLVGSKGQVIAIDGQEKAFELLLLNRFLNRRENLTCLHAIVGRRNDICVLPRQPNGIVKNLASCCFYHPGTRPSAMAALRTPVLMIALDCLELQKCDLLKIDVEEMELDVLKGAGRTIERHRPIVYFEQQMEHSFQEILGFFEDISYKLFWHMAQPFNQNNFRGCRENIFGGTREPNILARPKERISANIPSEITLQEITGREYAPPERVSVGSSWSLPENAYQDLPQKSTMRACEVLGNHD